MTLSEIAPSQQSSIIHSKSAKPGHPDAHPPLKMPGLAGLFLFHIQKPTKVRLTFVTILLVDSAN